ncbi:response regulator [Aeromicrobium sp. Root236]|uniref:response regulator n=1 Tax=Aeromicrobium sp. Root236 TaxID=1736498 RepID=UPI000AC5E78F|nr:response regulator [Aeromicrobium sp. Root236]
MKILLVEDEDRSLRQTSELIALADSTGSITAVVSRDEALDALRADQFDLLVCDLRLPPFRDSADVREEYGLAVHAAARQVCPGTPIIFLTAFATDTNLRDQLSSGGLGRVFGLPPAPLVQLRTKTESDSFVELVSALADGLSALHSEVALECSDPLDEMFDRGARAYARELGHSSVAVKGLSGLSAARVGRLSFRSETQSEAAVFMKVAHFEVARDEHERFVTLVATRLQPGTFAGALPPMTAGLRDQTALFSTLANSEHVSLFSLLTRSPADASQVVSRLRASLLPFESDHEALGTSLGDLRRESISDEKLAQSVPDFAAYAEDDQIELDIRRYLAHGDLHGENVLVDGSNRPILIDFGDVGTRAAPLDPITLELSLIFHTNGPARDTEWAATVDWGSWAEVDKFAAGSPFEPFIQACRAWAHDRDEPRAVYGTAYAHATRQLKYADVSKEIALSVAASAKQAMTSS